MSAFTMLDDRALVPAQAEHDPALDFPCSAAQERFWILEHLDPGNAALNVAVRWRIDAPLSAGLLWGAFGAVIARHEILRTAIVEVDGAPVQRVCPEPAFRLAEVDLSAVPEERREAEAEAVARREARAPFHLPTAPLLRATLLRLSPSQAIVLVTAHHVACDGWSIGIIAREVGLHYAALRDGLPGAQCLPALPLQYADYTLWQLELAAAGGLESQAEYWRKRLSGMRHFEVRPDRPRPPMQTTNGNILSLLLPRSLTDGLQALARRHGTTMFTAAFATLTAVLHRYTGETEVTLGTQVAGRDDVELEGLIGLFINTLVLRTDLSGDPGFSAHLDHVRAVVHGALDNQRMPIEHLVSMLRPVRDLSRNPLFSVNFILQRSFIENASYGDISLVDMPSVTAGALYDLNFFMVERPDGWRLSCEYNVDLFEGATITGLLEACRRLAAEVLLDPDLPVSAYVLVGIADHAAEASAPERGTVPAALLRLLPKPVAPGVRLHVVEPSGQPALPNAVGELRIEGIGPDAGSVGQGRDGAWRTGALVRRRHDGSIELLAPPSPRASVPASAVAPPASVGAGRPNSTEIRLAAIWAAILGVPSVAPTDGFFDLGGHSLLAARMLARVEIAFGHRPSLASLFRAPTVREFAMLLRPGSDGLKEHEAVAVRETGSRIPIFAINNTGIFHHLSRRLGPDQPFMAVSAYDVATPGELGEDTFEAVAARYVDIIRRVQPRGPYVLLGWCIAASLAFEVAQQLHRQGEDVPLLVLIDGWSPGFLARRSFPARFLAMTTYRIQFLAATPKPLVFLAGKIAEAVGTRLRRLRPRKAAKLAAKPDPRHPWFQGPLDTLARRYRPQPYAGATLLFHRSDQPSGRFLDPTFGWGDVVTGTLAAHRITGTHQSIFDEPGVGAMADQLGQALDALAARNADDGAAER